MHEMARPSAAHRLGLQVVLYGTLLKVKVVTQSSFVAATKLVTPNNRLLQPNFICKSVFQAYNSDEELATTEFYLQQ